MSKLTQETINELSNALQLGIESELLTVSISGKEQLCLRFRQSPKKDKKLHSFTRLVQGSWHKSPKAYYYEIERAEEQISPTLINFLLLTRLESKNMLTLARQDSRYQPYLKKLRYLPRPEESIEINQLSQASQLIFSRLKEQNKTLRELAQASELTQASLNNFKRGKDIRLSNFLKLAEALGLELRVQEKV